jgi:uncharacterized protein (UPF0332 family)
VTQQQDALLRKARRASETARNNVRDDDADAAVNRAYFAAHYAAMAALLEVGESPKTHSGTIQRFRERLIQTELLESHVGDTLTFSFNMRQRADYEPFAVFDAMAAADLVRDVELLIEAVSAMLRK